MGAETRSQDKATGLTLRAHICLCWRLYHQVCGMKKNLHQEKRVSGSPGLPEAPATTATRNAGAPSCHKITGSDARRRRAFLHCIPPIRVLVGPGHMPPTPVRVLVGPGHIPPTPIRVLVGPGRIFSLRSAASLWCHSDLGLSSAQRKMAEMRVLGLWGGHGPHGVPAARWNRGTRSDSQRQLHNTGRLAGAPRCWPGLPVSRSPGPVTGRQRGVPGGCTPSPSSDRQPGNLESKCPLLP